MYIYRLLSLSWSILHVGCWLIPSATTPAKSDSRRALLATTATISGDGGGGKVTGLQQEEAANVTVAKIKWVVHGKHHKDKQAHTQNTSTARKPLDEQKPRGPWVRNSTSVTKGARSSISQNSTGNYNNLSSSNSNSNSNSNRGGRRELGSYVDNTGIREEEKLVDIQTAGMGDFQSVCKLLSVPHENYPLKPSFLFEIFGEAGRAAAAEEFARKEGLVGGVRDRRGGGRRSGKEDEKKEEDRELAKLDLGFQKIYVQGGEEVAKAVEEEEREDAGDEEVVEVSAASSPQREEEEEEEEEEGEEEEEEGRDMLHDKRVMFGKHNKDPKFAKLREEYVKGKKRARNIREQFLIASGFIREEVDPPQRFVEVYYRGGESDDFYTAITTTSRDFGDHWSCEEAFLHDDATVLAYLDNWYAMVKKHNVLSDKVASLLQSHLGSGPARSEEEWRENPQNGEILTAIKKCLRSHRPPRVFAIGDVHGCIDELKALILQLDYSPGDLIIFLGDLVAKGPHSAAVVRLAREIGALSVRGNHENEVIRWHQAILAGAHQKYQSEHYIIASSLSEEDVQWLRSLPWYISCSDLKMLFVHAGFVFGLRLARQNPKLMTNMRSILPDGTVSSRYYDEYPWARLWFGPQTVMFGHDARRGLQMYDNAVGLDTGCVYGGNLSACILPDRTIASVPAKDKYIAYRYSIFQKGSNVTAEP